MTEAEAKKMLTEYGAPAKRGYDEILAVLGRQDHDGQETH